MRGVSQVPLTEDAAEQASYWCFRCAEGGLRLQEREAFSRWLSSAPSNRERFQAAVAAWHALRDPDREPPAFTVYTVPRGSHLREQLPQPGSALTHWYWVTILTVVLCAIGLMGFYILRLLL